MNLQIKKSEQSNVNFRQNLNFFVIVNKRFEFLSRIFRINSISFNSH